MDTLQLSVQKRDQRGKNEARRLRASGLVPAVLYGYKTETVPLAIDFRELRSTLAHSGHSVLELDFTDGGDGESVFAVIKEIQAHPTKQQVLHMDLLAVNLDEEIEAPVPIELVGEPVGVQEGGVLDQPAWEIMVLALPREVPNSVELDVSQLTIGESLTAADLVLPENVTLVDEPETTVASVLAPRPVEEEVTEEEGLPEDYEPEEIGAEAEEGAEAGEGAGGEGEEA